MLCWGVIQEMEAELGLSILVMSTLPKQGRRLVVLNYGRRGGAGLPTLGDVGVKVLAGFSLLLLTL